MAAATRINRIANRVVVISPVGMKISPAAVMSESWKVVGITIIHPAIIAVPWIHVIGMPPPHIRRIVPIGIIPPGVQINRSIAAINVHIVVVLVINNPILLIVIV